MALAMLTDIEKGVLEDNGYLFVPALDMTISVLWEDMRQGEAKSCTVCPIALAFRRAGVGNDWLDVQEDHAFFDHGGHTYMTILPDAVGDFIQAFDEGGMNAVRPITFKTYDTHRPCD